MNVFYVDKHPVRAAEQMCDKHIVKMILESAQLLSTCHRVQDGTEYYDKTANGRKIKRWKHPNPNLEPLLYKAGWVKHPSTIWLLVGIQLHLVIQTYDETLMKNTRRDIIIQKSCNN